MFEPTTSCAPPSAKKGGNLGGEWGSPIWLKLDGPPLWYMMLPVFQAWFLQTLSSEELIA